jgi:hypothetical protein
MRLELRALLLAPLLALFACSSADAPDREGTTEDALAAGDEYDEDLSPSATDLANEAEAVSEASFAPEVAALPDEISFDTPMPEDDVVFADGPPASAGPELDASLSPCGAPTPDHCAPSESVEILMYYERSAWDFTKAFCAHARPCEKLRYLTAKPSGTPLKPRVVPDWLRARAPRVSPSAEFHWSAGWNSFDVEKLGPGKFRVFKISDPSHRTTNWYLKGVVFRKWMARAGYRVSQGDGWHLNEVPSTWTQSLRVQHAMRAIAHGLHDGDPDDPNPEARLPVKGVLLMNGLGQTTKAPVYTATTLGHRRLWEDMDKWVDHFAVETYLHRGGPVCNGGAIGAQTTAIDAMAFGLPDRARSQFERGGRRSAARTAHAYLEAHYTPMLDMAWGFTGASAAPPSLLQMERFVSGEVYAARSYVDAHPAFDGRIGVYLRPAEDAHEIPLEPANEELANRIEMSLRRAYTEAAGAGVACPDGNPKDCVCAF